MSILVLLAGAVSGWVVVMGDGTLCLAGSLVLVLDPVFALGFRLLALSLLVMPTSTFFPLGDNIRDEPPPPNSPRGKNPLMKREGKKKKIQNVSSSHAIIKCQTSRPMRIRTG